MLFVTEQQASARLVPDWQKHDRHKTCSRARVKFLWHFSRWWRKSLPCWHGNFNFLWSH